MAGRDHRRVAGEDEGSSTTEMGIIRDNPNSRGGPVSPTTAEGKHNFIYQCLTSKVSKYGGGLVPQVNLLKKVRILGCKART